MNVTFMVNKSKQDDKCDIQTYHSKYIEELRIHVMCEVQRPNPPVPANPRVQKGFGDWTIINYEAHSLSS